MPRQRARPNRTFTDLTFDMQNDPLATWCALVCAVQQANASPGFTCLWAPAGIHPDQHAIVVNPSNPTQIFEGSDGGVIRTGGTFGDFSSRCNSNERRLLSSAQPWHCERMLSRVPTRIDAHQPQLRTRCSSITSPSTQRTRARSWAGPRTTARGRTTIGCGTGNCSRRRSTETAATLATTGRIPTWRFNEFTSGFTDSNFKNGDPEKWVISSAPLVNSGEVVVFYWPQVADPNPRPGAHPIFSGAQHVWRTWAFGAGDSRAGTRRTRTRTSPSTRPTVRSSSCSAADPDCGDYQPLGGPQGTNQPGDLTGTVYGADRGGGSISWMARNRPTTGRCGPRRPAAACSSRTTPTRRHRPPSPGTASTMRPRRLATRAASTPTRTTRAGRGSRTRATTQRRPTTPGHVFEVREGGTAAGSGVFTNLNVERGTRCVPDAERQRRPAVNDVVRDDARKCSTSPRTSAS